MTTVDDPTVVSRIDVGLGTKLESEVLDDVRAGTGKRGSNAAQVDNNRLDAVTFAFDLGLDPFHLVTIEGVGDITADIDESHFDGLVTRVSVRVLAMLGKLVVLVGMEASLWSLETRENTIKSFASVGEIGKRGRREPGG